MRVKRKFTPLRKCLVTKIVNSITVKRKFATNRRESLPLFESKLLKYVAKKDVENLIKASRILGLLILRFL